MNRMRVSGRIAGLVVAAMALVAFAVAGEGKSIEVTGKVACAKCTLKMADAKTCQDVLVVKNDKGETTNYYLVKNDVLTKFGHTCTGQKDAKVAGTVAEKDGKMWLTPTSMEEAKG